MKKIKEDKGITLVALIITIVVLLILAAVAIGTVRNSDIIGYSQNAAGSFNQAKDNEITTLQNSEQLIEENIPKNNEFQGELKLNTKYYMSGKEGTAHVIFYSDGSCEFAGETMEYTNSDGKVEFNSRKFEINNEGECSVLISSEMIDNSGTLLLATNMDGLKYFSGERYENSEETYVKAIILNENSSVVEYYSGRGEWEAVPVLYKGVLYNVMTVSVDNNGNEAFITTNDNCETLIVNGKVYTKVTE